MLSFVVLVDTNRIEMNQADSTEDIPVPDFQLESIEWILKRENEVRFSIDILI